MSAAPPAGRAQRIDAALLALVRGSLITVAVGAFISPPLANLGAALALLGFVALPSARARARAAWAQPLAGATALLIAVLAASMLWSDAPWSLRLSALWNWRALLLLLVGLAVFDEAPARSRVALVFALAAAAGALVVLAGRYGLIAPRVEGEPAVYLRNAVTQAMTLAVGGYFATMLALTQRQWHGARRIALAAVALLLLVTLFASGRGRSGHLTALILLAVTAVHYLRGWRLGAAVVGVPLIGVAVAAVSPGVQERFAAGWHELRSHSTGTELTSMGMRAVMWRTTAELIAERPLLGYGLGAFPRAYASKVKAQYSGWMATGTSDPHNQYLALLVDSGVPGLLAFVWFLVAATRQRAPLPWRLVGIALLAGWCVTSLFSSHFHTFSEGHLIAVFAAAFLAHERRAGGAGASTGADQPASAESTAPSTAS